MIFEPTIAAIGMMVCILGTVVLQDLWKERTNVRAVALAILWAAAIYLIIRFMRWALPFFVS